jgi:hypothetical protein
MKSTSTRRQRKALNERPDSDNISESQSTGTQEDIIGSMRSDDPHKDEEMGNQQRWKDETGPRQRFANPRQWTIQMFHRLMKRRKQNGHEIT